MASVFVPQQAAAHACAAAQQDVEDEGAAAHACAAGEVGNVGGKYASCSYILCDVLVRVVLTLYAKAGLFQIIRHATT